MKQGSYVNIWVPRNSTVKEEESEDPYEPVNFGYVNHSFKKTEDSQVVGLGFVPIEKRIEECCRKLKINFITKSEKHSLYDTVKYKKVTFADEGEKDEEEEEKYGMEEGPYVMIQLYVPDDVLEEFCIELQKCGVGVVPDTGFSVLPTSVNIFSAEQRSEDQVVDGPQKQKNVKKKTSFSSANRIEKFYKSIKSRLIVVEVIKRIESGAEFSFDFVTYLVAAAAIAFMGLVENSTVSLVASMLISPLMGPILAIVFGRAIKNKKLMRIGLKRELYALGICVLCGFLFGCIFVLKFNRSRNLLAVSSPKWPTTEMLGRTGWSCLVVGVCVAVPSGVGVALAVLGGNQAGGVGVAISASLLPPAVNTGLLFAMALISYIYNTNTEDQDQSAEKFEFEYSEGNIPLELFLRGLVSLCLTIVNILGILLFGVLTLYIKQVTPLSIPQRNASFWRNDVQLNKEYEKSIQSEDLEELKAEGAELGLSEKVIEELFQEAANDQHVIESRKWVEVNYPSDDLDTYRDEDVITIESEPVHREPNHGRFHVTKMRSMRRNPVCNISSIVKEEVRNAAQVFERRLSQEEGMDPVKKTNNVDRKPFFNAEQLNGIKGNSPPQLEFVHIV